MPVTSRDLCDLAEDLLRPGASEAQVRASLSRAYYSGFHALLPFVARLPKSKKCRPGATHITHEDFAERLAEWKTAEVHPALARLSTTAGQLLRATDANRGFRVRADYKLNDRLALAEAKMQVQRTRLIMRALAQLESAMEPVQGTG